MNYEVWVPWPEIIDHEQLLYLNETDGRLDFYYVNAEGTLRVRSTNYRMAPSVVMFDENDNDVTPADVQDEKIYILTECSVLKLRKTDAATFSREVDKYEDNFLTQEGDDD